MEGSLLPETDTIVRKIAVLKEIPETERKPIMKRIGLLKRAPAEAPVAPPDVSGMMGPRFDIHGHLVPHSILGAPEEFYKEALKRGHLQLESVPPEFRHCFPDMVCSKEATMMLPVTPRVRKSTPPVEKRGGPICDPETSALEHWQRKMKERRRCLKHVSDKIVRPMDRMVMNQEEEFRYVMEERYLIERTLPFYDHGTDPRVGSEYWKQQEVIGEENGLELHLTLKQTERGYPPAIEHIGLPRICRMEKGLDYEPTMTPRYPWKFPYYIVRQEEMAEVLDELDPLPRPTFEQLQIIGKRVPPPSEEKERSTNEDCHQSKLEREERLEPEEPGQTVDSLSDEESPRLSEGLPGPALIFGGYPARWTGDSTSFEGNLGIEARVIFQCATGENCVEYLEVINEGSTIVNYEWKQIKRPNPFQLVQQPVRRFYFDVQGGVLLPGEKMLFPFVFKSDCAGIFTEQWILETIPVVCGGAALLATLRGIALEDDPNRQIRENIDRNLTRRAGEKIVRSILYEILNGIQMQTRPKTAIDSYLTTEEIFRRLNPQIEYTIIGTSKLEALYQEYKKFLQTKLPAAVDSSDPDSPNYLPENWNLSVSDLRNKILCLPEEFFDQKEKLAKKLFTILNNLGVKFQKPFVPIHGELYKLGYEILHEFIGQLYDEATYLRLLHGLSEIQFQIPHYGDKSHKSHAAPSTTMAKPDGKKSLVSNAKSSPPGKAIKSPGQNKGPSKSDKTDNSTEDSPEKQEQEEFDQSDNQPLPQNLEDNGDESDPKLESKWRRSILTLTYSMLCNACDKMEASWNNCIEEFDSCH